jgi:aryl-alcohol dehydrogenase
MAGCGICHADLGVRDNGPTPVPAVFGHEGSGVVERVGSAVTMVAPGDHVVLCAYSCGLCEYCLSGHPALCIQNDRVNFGGIYMDGTKRLRDEDGVELSCFFGQSSFSEYVVTDQQNAVNVDKDIDIAMLGPLGCGFQTGAGAVLNVLRPVAGDTIAVFGCGSVGLAALMAAKMSGCMSIIGVDNVDLKLDLAKELGATHMINTNTEPNVTGRIMEITNGRGLDFTFQTTGVETLFASAIDSLRKGGTCGTVASTGEKIFGYRMDSLMNRCRRLVGIVQGDSVPQLFIPKLIRFYMEGLFPFDRLISFYPLDDINKAADDAHHGRVIKPVLRY